MGLRNIANGKEKPKEVYITLYQTILQIMYSGSTGNWRSCLRRAILSDLSGIYGHMFKTTGEIMSKKSKTKGVRGEREFAEVLNSKFGTQFKRTPQSGGMDFKGDIISVLNRDSRANDFHWEVKRQEKLNIYKAIEQATLDSRGSFKTPTVAHRRNKDSWMITMYADDFLNLVKELDDLSSS